MRLIGKPFRREQLARKVADAIGEPPHEAVNEDAGNVVALPFRGGKER